MTNYSIILLKNTMIWKKGKKQCLENGGGAYVWSKVCIQFLMHLAIDTKQLQDVDQ